MKQFDGGVTSVAGFKVASFAAGIKPNRKDMAMIVSEKPCKAAGVFTTNVVKAAPVKWDKMVVTEAEYAQAVVINAGVANACTGIEGYNYCKDTAKAAADLLKINEDAVLVASTGVIGQQLPMDKILNGVKNMVPMLGSSREEAHEAAKAIMTTDTKPKEVAFTFEVGGKECTIAGMCKGSGMIHPNMATMLCFVVTDVAISHELLQKALSNDVVDTFNMISVDGDTSTNDSVLLMANGLAGNEEITSENEDYKAFCGALHAIMVALSQKIAGDGEGCTCLFEVTVKGAKTKESARVLAKSVVTSSLVKAAIFGHDANWGRILCALGYSGEDFDPEKVEIWFTSEAGELKIVENGISTGYSEELATKILSQEKVTALVQMNDGSEEATAWGCDLTYDYVKINADYRS